MNLFAILFSLCFLVPVSQAKLKGTVKIDGSSTVFPITEAVAEEFAAVEPRVRVNVAVSGTGGGFKKFVSGETDINNASREIKDSELAKAKQNKIDFVKIPVAFDGITVVVHPENKWASNLTVAQLKELWSAGGKIKKWSDLNAKWPTKDIKLFGPGTDSGTFDYFKEVVVGHETAVRSDFIKSEDDNVLVRALKGEKYGLGFFGFAYYKENRDSLKALKVGGVDPNMNTIQDGSYAPLSRTVFIYVNKESIKRPELKAFLKFYLEQAAVLSAEVGYIPLQAKTYKEAIANL